MAKPIDPSDVPYKLNPRICHVPPAEAEEKIEIIASPDYYRCSYCYRPVVPGEPVYVWRRAIKRPGGKSVTVETIGHAFCLESKKSEETGAISDFTKSRGGRSIRVERRVSATAGGKNE